MQFNNPAPSIPTGIVLSGGTKQLTVNWTPCPDIDYAGTIVQISTSAGGTYTTAGEVLGSSITISGLAQSTQYFVKLAHYDKFGKTGLNWSAPVSTYTDNFNSLVDARIGAAVISGSQLLGNSIPSSALSTEALYAPLAVIGDVRNFVRNSLGDNGTKGWDGLVSASNGFDWTTYTGGSYKGQSCLTFNDRDATYGDLIPVSPGDQFWVSATHIPTGGTTCNYAFGVGVAVYDKNKNSFNWHPGFTRATSVSGAQTSSGSLTVTSSDAVYIKPWVTIIKPAGTNTTGSNGNGMHVSNITVTRKNKGELIVDGTITGNHILANSITADKIDTRSLTIKDAAGNVIFGSGTNIDYSRVNASSGWLNSNIGVDGNGYLTGAGNSVQVANSQVYANPSSNWLNSNITVNPTGYLTGAGSVVQVANTALPTGTNLVYNPDFSNGAGIDGWTWLTTTAGISTSDVVWGKNWDTPWYLSPWSGKGTDVAYLRQINRKGNVNYHAEISSAPIPVAPNTKYISSGYTGAHRCKVAIFAYFYDATGANIGNSYNGNCENNEEAAGGQSLGGYKRCYGEYTTPSNVSFARLVLRKYDTAVGQPDSWMFVTKVQLEAVGSTCSVPGPWTDSGIMDPTSIRAVNPITPANVSTYIASAAIGNAQIGVAAIGTANIQNAAIKNAQIDNLAVTNSKIANLSVDTLKIANESATIVRGYTNNTAYPGNDGANTVISDYDFYLPYAAKIIVMWQGKQTYLSGTRLFALHIRIDGTTNTPNTGTSINYTGSIGFGVDLPVIYGQADFAAGWHKIQIQWDSSSTMYINNSTLVLMISMK